MKILLLWQRPFLISLIRVKPYLKEQFVTYKPKNEVIAKYISYYYFHQSFDDNFKRSFVYYPHFKNTITISKDAVAERTKTSSTYRSKKGNLEIYYNSNINLKKSRHLIGQLNKIGIVFTPLGINHFLNCELSKISSKPEFDFFHFGEDFENQLFQVYDTNDFNRKIELLDAFFTSKYNADLDTRIIDAVERIIQSKGGITS